MNDFEEVKSPVAELNSSEIFFKQKRKPSSDKNSREWKNKLNLKRDVSMDNRKVEITGFQLIKDGYLSSHKEYKIKSSLPNENDEKEISRRYSDFEWLVSQLLNKYPGCIIPPLPEKNPLTNINQENEVFLQNRKRGLLRFLEKMIQHPDLRYAPDFISFLLSNDIEFNTLVEKSKKPGSFMPIVTSLIEHMPSAPMSFLSNIYSKFVEGEKMKSEKSENDHTIDNHDSYITFLESSLTELTKYANQMGTVEKDQSNVLLDLSSNLNEISKFDKNNKLDVCKKMSDNTEQCSDVQKEHSKYFNEDLELKLKEINAFVIAAKSAIKRRNELKEIIEKNDAQISELERQRNGKYLDMLNVNEENKNRLEEIDKVLLDELQDFEGEIIFEIDQVARDFMAHQTRYAKKMYESWTAN